MVAPIPVPAGQEPVLLGIAVPFDVLSWMSGGVLQRVRAGAFMKFLATAPDVRAVVNHQHEDVIASTGEGTLSLMETAAGLAFRLSVRPTNVHAQHMLRALRWGQVRGVSCRLRRLTIERQGVVVEVIEGAIEHVGLLDDRRPVCPNTWVMPDGAAARRRLAIQGLTSGAPCQGPAGWPQLARYVPARVHRSGRATS